MGPGPGGPHLRAAGSSSTRATRALAHAHLASSRPAREGHNGVGLLSTMNIENSMDTQGISTACGILRDLVPDCRSAAEIGQFSGFLSSCNYRCLALDDYPNLYWRYLGYLQTIRSVFSLDCQSFPEFFPNCSGMVVRSAGRALRAREVRCAWGR